MRDQCRRSSRTLEVGLSQRESRTDKAQQATLTGKHFETRDKQEGGDVDMTTATDKRKAEELERTDSPARARARTMSKSNVELSRKSKETPWGFHTMDAGRDGDCGYRALAAALKLAAGDPPEKAKANAAKHGASLRARAATWIKKKGKFKDSFALTIVDRTNGGLDRFPRRTMSGLSRVPSLGGGSTDQGTSPPQWCWREGFWFRILGRKVVSCGTLRTSRI